MREKGVLQSKSCLCVRPGSEDSFMLTLISLQATFSKSASKCGCPSGDNHGFIFSKSGHSKHLLIQVKMDLGCLLPVFPNFCKCRVPSGLSLFLWVPDALMHCLCSFYKRSLSQRKAMVFLFRHIDITWI